MGPTAFGSPATAAATGLRLSWELTRKVWPFWIQIGPIVPAWLWPLMLFTVFRFWNRVRTCR